MRYLALPVALVSKDSGSRGAALDALIAGIEDGRAAPGRLAEVLLLLLPGGCKTSVVPANPPNRHARS